MECQETASPHVIGASGKARQYFASRGESSLEDASHPSSFPPDAERMLTFLLWCLLLVICWPLALLVLFLYPLVWLVLLPFRLIGLTFAVIFETLDAILSLPARIARRLA